MQPHLYFDHGFCNYDCTVCGDVCPTGALKPLTVEEKRQTQMGQVHFISKTALFTAMKRVAVLVPNIVRRKP